MAFSTQAQLWDADSGALVAQTTPYVNSISNFWVNPNGQTLLTNEGTLSYPTQWEVTTGQHQPFPARLGSDAVFDPTGQTIRSDSGFLPLYDAQTGAALQKMTSSVSAHTLLYDRAGEWWVAGGGEKVWLWEGTALTPARTFDWPEHQIYHIAQRPDGHTLVVVAAREVATLDLQTGQLQVIIPDLPQPSHGANWALSPNGLALATEGEDGLWLYDLTTGTRQWLPDQASPIFSPDGRLLLTSDYGPGFRAKLWEVPTGNLLGDFTSASAAFSTDGNTLFVARYAPQTLEVWDIRDVYALLGAGNP